MAFCLQSGIAGDSQFGDEVGAKADETLRRGRRLREWRAPSLGGGDSETGQFGQ
ncbi:hypothetical protein SAMN06265338_101167 [Rhodoblastus acidophilus]|uniref:Uncharacterized protein n=1 Tax=Rhodoblastus acidophilus TaxID=1074 RepID=A0A212PY77_RHOAC|nr:hypothetical protein SAMN06265338_101167 [Rhodoblastus acidophilus]